RNRRAAPPHRGRGPGRTRGWWRPRRAPGSGHERLFTETVMGIYRSARNGASAAAGSAFAVREASLAELECWDELVRGFPNCRVVHTRAWVRSLEACGKGRPLYLVFEQTGEVVGCLPGLLVRVGPF